MGYFQIIEVTFRLGAEFANHEMINMLSKYWRDYRRSKQSKADLLTATCIAFALPSYYKIKFVLEDKMNLTDLLTPWGLLEIVFAFGLSLILLSFYRFSDITAPSLIRQHQIISGAIKLVIAGLIALLFTRFFFNVVVEWGTDASFEFDVILLSILLPLIVSGISEKIFFRTKAQEAEKAELIAKYEALKARISPHFLFNSLNSLIDIIEEDPTLAVEFVEEMANVYRYILEYRDVPLVPLDTEIKAISSLLFIHEIRRPNAIKVSINIDDEKGKMQVVPMALQTLIENALKHNKYNATEPIQICISAEEEHLLMENSLNKKLNVPSTQEGLDNLSKRIHHVCHRDLTINESETAYRVMIPLVAS